MEKKKLATTGVEPAIFCLGGRRLIRLATRLKKLPSAGLEPAATRCHPKIKVERSTKTELSRYKVHLNEFCSTEQKMFIRTYYLLCV